MAIAILFFISACTKIESTTIGSGLLPPIDGVTTLDTTLDVVTNNFIDPLGDDAKVYKTDEHVIGVINDDPIFGKTTATAFFELKPTSYPFSLPNVKELTPDSAVLILSYKGVFGNTMLNQNWEVREVLESMRGDTVFNVKKSFATGNLLGSASIDIPHLKDSINNRFENSNNQIRIKLSQSFATTLMKQYDSLANGAYASDSLFRLNFKGFAVMPTANSGGNALLRVNLSDTNTKLALFYNYQIKDSAVGKRETAVSYFRFSNGSNVNIPVSGNANYIKRERTGSQLTQFLNTNGNDSFVFIQAMPGTFATIKIQGLKTFPNAIIHRAELLAFQAPDPDPTPLHLILTPPRYLLLNAIDSDNKLNINVPNDFIVSQGSPNISTFGGFITEKAVPENGIVKAYTFDLSRYVQGIITRKETSYTLKLSAPSNDSLRYTPPYPQSNIASTFYVVPSFANNVANGRVRLGGGGMTKENQLRMRLRIVYSKL
ncbi:MAG: DUF4270 family protein [Segetibacter sp.]